MRIAAIALVVGTACAPVCAQTVWGIQTFGTANGAQNLITFDVTNPAVLNTIGSTGFATTGTFINGVAFGPGGTDLYLATVAPTAYFHDVDQNTGLATNPRGSGLNAGDTIGDLSWDSFNNRMLAISTQGVAGTGARLYTIDLTSGNATLLGAVTNYTEGFTVSLAVRPSDGMIFAHGVETDRYYMIDPNTLAATALTAFGIDTNFGQGSTFDPTSGILYHAMLTTTGGNMNRLATIDTVTGLPTFIGTLGVGLTQISDIAFPDSGGGCGCVCNYDTSTGNNVCDIFDFLTFGNLFSAADPCACDLDTSTGLGVCDIFDFLEFGNLFNAGC